MNQQIKTPPHRANPDWYRVKYRLASTLTNRAFITKDRSARRLGYTRARKEIDELLRACWSTLEPLPFERLRAEHREVRKFVAETALGAALDLKALIELGVNEEPGEDEELNLKSVNRRLRKGRPVTPRTIVYAILAENSDPRPSLMLDLACFLNQCGERERAKDCAAAAFAKLPAAERDRARARAATDPMLKTIPGIVDDGEKRRCHWPKRGDEKAKKPPRPWF